MATADQNTPASETAAEQTAVSMSVEKVTISYAAHVAVREVSLVIPPRAITAIIGPSGCGKTSLLNSMNRLTDLIPQAEVRGAIWLGAQDVLDRATDVIQLRRRVGMIFQRPNPFPMSIRRNLELPLHEHGVRAREAMAERMEGALRDVGLWEEVKDRLHQNALSLSGGQQQRLCLARALALRPDVLLLDEPCSALDPLAAGVVEELLAALRSRYTLVVVTHNLAQARRLADRVAVFWSSPEGGRLIEHGETEQVFQNPQAELTNRYVRGLVG